MPRYCLLGHVDPSRLDEYRRGPSRGVARAARGAARCWLA